MAEYEPNMRERRGPFGRTVPSTMGRTAGDDTPEKFVAPSNDEKYRPTAEALHGQDTGWFNPEVREWSESLDPRDKLPPMGDSRGLSARLAREKPRGSNPYVGFDAG